MAKSKASRGSQETDSLAKREDGKSLPAQTFNVSMGQGCPNEKIPRRLEELPLSGHRKCMGVALKSRQIVISQCVEGNDIR